MKTVHLICLAFAVLTGLLLAVSSVAEEIQWGSSLNEAYEQAAKEGKAVLVLAAQTVSDPIAKKVAEQLAAKENAGLVAVFVLLRLNGTEADKVKQQYTLRKLPAVAILAPSGKILDALYDDSLTSIAAPLSHVVAELLPTPDAGQIIYLMETAAAQIGIAPNAETVLKHERILKGLDALIEQARPRRVRDNNQNNMRGIDAANNQQGEEEGSSGEGTGSGGGRTGSEPGNVDGTTGGVSSAEWGKLPPRLREDASGASGEEIPPSYRELVEEYFRKLMGK